MFFLKNVVRLLKSPTSQRGRDYAIMLATFAELGYTVEWRVNQCCRLWISTKKKEEFSFLLGKIIPIVKNIQKI